MTDLHSATAILAAVSIIVRVGTNTIAFLHVLVDEVASTIYNAIIEYWAKRKFNGISTNLRLLGFDSYVLEYTLLRCDISQITQEYIYYGTLVQERDTIYRHFNN